MTAPTNRDGEAGFLLADMLATLTISALVLAGLAGLGSLMLRSVNRSVAAVEASDDLGRTLGSLDRLIEAAVRTRLDGAAAQPFLFNGDEHRLMMARRDTTPGGSPVTRVVALRGDGSRLLWTEAALPPRIGGLEELQFGPPRVVYAGSARIRFAYVAAPQGPGAAQEPLARWPVGGGMPAAVIIQASDGATGQTVAQVRATIAANADLGCLVDGACGRADRTARAGAAASESAPMNPISAGAQP